MNYRVFTDTVPPRLLANFEREIALRPRVGDIITFGTSMIQWVITREQDSPFENITEYITEDGIRVITEEGLFVETEESDKRAENEAYGYFAEIQNSSRQSTSLRFSDDDIQRKLERFG